MALPIPPINPNTRIPNNPFYYPETNYLKGEYGPFIVGSGFSINNNTGTITVSGGGSGAPTILAGQGIAVTSGTGTVTITNTGILSVTAGAGIGVSVAGGNLNIVNTSPAPTNYGTVTSVATGAGLTGGPITTNGVLSLTTTGVAPGTYNNATITVDSYGRITFAAPGASFGTGITATGPIQVTSTFPQNVSIQAATTAASGAVRLNDTVTSTSTSQAATANAVKVTYDVASQAQTDATNANTAATAALTQSSAAQAQAATANTNSVTALAAATSAQNDATTALSAAAAAQSSANTALTTANAAQTAANSANANANNRIPCSAFVGVGQLLVGTGPGTFTAFGAGINGRILSANSLCASGLEWVPQTAGTVTNIITGVGLAGGPITNTGTIYMTNTGVTPGSYTNANITVDAQGRISSASNGSGGGVTQIVAGTNVTISPVGGTGIVTINATGGSTVADATPTVPGIVAAYTDTSDTDFSTALGYCALNSQAGGVANTAIGVCSGVAITTGYLNTLLGAASGFGIDGGIGNIFVGGASGCALTSGNFNIALGNCAGCNYTTETGNVILGGAPGVALECETITLSTGTGAIRQKFDCGGALSFDGSSYGGVGQVLTSQGANTRPTWTTVASSGGTVTSITPGTGLCASSNPITTSGTICLTNTGVAAASYTNASITVDAQGRLTAASSGTPPVTAVTGTAPIAVTTGTTPVVSICSASTTALGAVQLTNALNSTSETLALTACAGQCLQSQITALAVSGTVELAGTIDASTGFVASITSVGSADGYTVGAVLPAASATTVNTYVIVTTPGTMTPPGGSATAATRGDWFLVSETSPGVYDWTFLNVGFDAPAATTTVAGIVCLSTNALAQAGTDTTTALTPAAATSAFIPNSCITAKGSLITGTAANTPTALPVGFNGQYLVANSACSTGLEWVSAMGDTPVGAINWFSASTAPLGWLVADGRAVSRSTYAALFSIVGTTYGAGDGSTTFNLPDLRGQFLRGWDAAGGTARGCDPGRAFGSNQGFALQNHCHQLEVFNGAAARPEWACPNNACPAGASYASAAGAFVQRTAGFTSTNGSSETRPTNVALLPCIKWQVTTAPSSCGIPCSCITAKGTLITGDAPNNPVSLPVGADGQALVACAACAFGLTWTTPAVPVSPATPTIAGTVLGCTTAGNAALGPNALLNGGTDDTALGVNALRAAKTAGLEYQNVAVGPNAMCSYTCGFQNVSVGSTSLCNLLCGISNDAVGALSMVSLTCGSYNVSLGGYSLFCLTSGCFNTATGHRALTDSTTGCCNTALGAYAGQGITSGCFNLALGFGAQVASPTGSCQMAMGYCSGCYWLTGTSTKAIKPGAGIIDCTNTCGVLGQVLMSTGANSVCWGYGNPYPAWTSAGTIQSVGWTSTGGVNVVPGSTSRNNVSYRQVGIKEWQVVYTFTATGGFTNAGSGQYLFVLPNGLQFDTTLPWQPVFTGGASPSHANRQYFLPGPSSMQITFTGGGNGAQFGMGVVVYNATRFRIFATDVGNGAPQPVANGYWGGSDQLTFSVSFQFTSL